MPDLLLGILEKLARGEKHIREADRLIKRYRVLNPYRLERQLDLKRTEIDIRLYIYEPVPALELGSIIGDAVNNFRSALDQLIWTLTIQRQLRLPAEPQPGGCWWQSVAFPVRYSPWPASHPPPGCKGIDPRLWPYVREVQPFSTGQLNRDPLWLLRQLSNWDKHRSIPVVLSFARYTPRIEVQLLSAVFGQRAGFRPVFIQNPERPVEDSDVLVTLEITDEFRSITDLEPYLSTHGYFTIDIALERGNWGWAWGVRSALRQMSQRAADIVATLGPFVRARTGRYPHLPCPDPK